MRFNRRPPCNHLLMTITQKLLLLQSAVAHPFTSKASLLSFLSSQHPQIENNFIETFFDDLIDFELLSKERVEETFNVKEENVHEVKIDSQEHIKDDPTTEEGTTMTTSDNNDYINPTTATANPSAPTPSPQPHLVPVRTPSGRTLRSNSTVNTSEPRRLRSNK